MERGNTTLLWAPSSVNRRFWAVGDGEGYLCLEQNVYGNLWEQVEHLQCETQEGIECDALILCQGVDSGPHVMSFKAILASGRKVTNCLSY